MKIEAPRMKLAVEEGEGASPRGPMVGQASPGSMSGAKIIYLIVTTGNTENKSTSLAHQSIPFMTLNKSSYGLLGIWLIFHKI